MGAGWVSFLRFFLLAYSGSSAAPFDSASGPPPLQPLPAPIVLAPSPPPPRPASLLPRCQPSLGRGLRRGGQTKGPGQTRGHPTAAPHHVAPFLRARVQLPLPFSSQRSGGVRPPHPHHPFPALFAPIAPPRVLSLRASRIPRNAPVAGGGDAQRTEAALSVPRLGNGQTKRGRGWGTGLGPRRRKVPGLWG